MLHGNISNEYGYCIAFRCEGFLIKYKDKILKDKVLNFFKGKYKCIEINKTILAAMEYIYKNTEYNVGLVVEEKSYKDIRFKKLVDSLPFNEIILINKLSQISQRLLIGYISLYVDDNAERRSLINNKYAISFEELNHHIKIGVKR